jgi:hypothetical protein
MYYPKSRPFDGNAVVSEKKIFSHLIALVDCFVVYVLALTIFQQFHRHFEVRDYTKSLAREATKAN